MATSALSAVTDALYTLLETANIGATVYRYVPENPAFPYVTIASATENRRDRFGKSDKTLLLQVHVFTSSDTYAGAGQALAILAAVNAATEYASLSLASPLTSVLCRPEDALDAGDDVVSGVRYAHWVQHVRVNVAEG